MSLAGSQVAHKYAEGGVGSIDGEDFQGLLRKDWWIQLGRMGSRGVDEGCSLLTERSPVRRASRVGLKIARPVRVMLKKLLSQTDAGSVSPLV